MSMMQEFNEAMIWKIMYDQFMNQVQVIQNLYGEYNRDTLSLLDDADYKERLVRLRDVSEAYVSISIEMLKTEHIIKRIEDRIEEFRKIDDAKGMELWQDELEDCKRWLDMQKALFKQAQAQFALFRPLALVKAFEQKKKRGSIMGTGRNIMNELLGRKKKEEEVILKEVGEGLDPEVVLEEAMKDAK